MAIFQVVILTAGMAFMSGSSLAAVGGYQKATEGEDVIKNKSYPKKGHVELNGPNVGLILNQSYLNTYLVNGGINYFWTETWGLGIEGYYGMSQDRQERTCIETFYNDPNNNMSAKCGDPSVITNAGQVNGISGDYGPAYVNIRQYNYLLAANAIWNPIYGKEIFFLSGVVNFDVFVTLGGGLAFSTFYPLTTTLKNGNPSRGTFPAPGQPGTPPGTNPNDPGGPYYGVQGRPTPTDQTNVFLDAGIGQKIHFAQRFNAKVEIRNHIVLGTPSGFDTFFTLWGGLGMRF